MELIYVSTASIAKANINSDSERAHEKWSLVLSKRSCTSIAEKTGEYKSARYGVTVSILFSMSSMGKLTLNSRQRRKILMLSCGSVNCIKRI